MSPVLLTVLAAASLMDVLPKIYDAWPSSAAVQVSFNFDASSRLARQAEQGAPADVFISADEEWMDYAVSKKAAVQASRRILAGNRLVVVAPVASKLEVKDALDLREPQVKRLALAGENVPAGKYAAAALTKAGVWKDVEPRVVRGDTVRAALNWTARGEADAAVVYASDAASEPKVRILFQFPAGSHAPIVYPAAVLSGSKAKGAAAEFLKFCAGSEAAVILRQAGFSPPP